MPLRRSALATAGLSLALAASACASSTTTASPAASTAAVTVTIAGVGDVPTDAALAAKFPADSRGKAAVTVATNAPYEPFIAFVTEGDATKFKGLDYDLVQ